MDFRPYCKSYQHEGLTLYLLPYRNVATVNAVRALSVLEPPTAYLHKTTGVALAQLPADATPADWRELDLWTNTHNIFVLALPVLIAVDVDDSVTLSTETCAFVAFWNDRQSDFKRRWHDFQHVVSATLLDVVWGAYNATRETVPVVAEMPKKQQKAKKTA